MITNVLVLHCLNCLEFALEEIKGELRDSGKEMSYSKKRVLIEEVSKIDFKTCPHTFKSDFQTLKIEELVSNADNMFGGILFMEFTNALVTGSSQVYFVITLPFGISNSGKV